MPLDLTNATEGKLSLACGAGVFFLLKKTRKYKDRGRHLESNGVMEKLRMEGRTRSTSFSISTFKMVRDHL